MFSKLIVCEPPSMDTFSEEGVTVNLQHTINDIEIAQDNKFILFAEQMKDLTTVVLLQGTLGSK